MRFQFLDISLCNEVGGTLNGSPNSDQGSKQIWGATINEIFKLKMRFAVTEGVVCEIKKILYKEKDQMAWKQL